MKPRDMIATIFMALALVATAATPAFSAQDVKSAQPQRKVHHVVLHVDENSPKRMNMVLNNVRNIRKYYDAKGEKVIIEVVAYGPGLHMMRADTSPVKERISRITTEFDDVKFSACGNTHRIMSKKAGRKITLVPEARLVPSGVVRLIELQEQGYAYVRP